MREYVRIIIARNVSSLYGQVDSENIILLLNVEYTDCNYGYSLANNTNLSFCEHLDSNPTKSRHFAGAM